MYDYKLDRSIIKSLFDKMINRFPNIEFIDIICDDDDHRRKINVVYIKYESARYNIIVYYRDAKIHIRIYGHEPNLTPGFDNTILKEFDLCNVNYENDVLDYVEELT